MSIVSWLRRRLHLDEDDFQEEVRAHLAIAASERMAEGSDAKTAEYASLKDFGNVTLTTEAARDVWRPHWVEVLRDYADDARYAVRSLVKPPLFALTVIAVLTLGVGLNATVFTIFKSIYLTPLAGVKGSAQLAVLYTETSGGRQLRVSYPDYKYLRDHNRSFSQLMGTCLATVNFGRGRGARQLWGELVTGNYFEVLGVRAQRGRTLVPSDEVAPGRHPVVVLGNSLWRREFNADPDIVGKTVEINRHALTVVGVADAKFHGTIVSYESEVFIPVMMAPTLGFVNFNLDDRGSPAVHPHGYLKPGVAVTAAAAEMTTLWETISRDRPLEDPGLSIKVVPFWRSPTGGQTYILPTMMVLSAMGPLVLLIACANIAGLVLVRGMARRGEIAVRLALGATRARIVRLLVLENVVLALPGAALGVVLAMQGIPVLLSYAEWLAAPQRLFLNIEIDSIVIGFAALIACLCAVVFGFVPALRSSRVDLVRAINEDASPRGASRGRMRSGLVVAQVAVSMLLLVAAGLVTQSLDAARKADVGFDGKQVAALDVEVKLNAYDEKRGRVFYRKLLEAARAARGIESATVAAYLPLQFTDSRTTPVAVEGYTSRPGEDMAFPSNTVGPGYLRTLRVRLEAGREFEDRDDESSERVAMVNKTFALRFWNNPEDALGKRIRAGNGEWRTVIGVAADLKYTRIDESPRPYVYVPFLQAYRSAMVLHTRGAAPVNQLVDQARAIVTELDPDMPILFARPFSELMRGALIFLELSAVMLFAFGVSGMLLAGMGTYGLVAYTVRQSNREIGIRMALGATASSVVRVFIARGMRLALVGALLGIVGAFGAGRLLSSVLFGVSATNAVAFLGAAGVVIGGVLIASMIPAARAARTNALDALRHQ